MQGLKNFKENKDSSHAGKVAGGYDSTCKIGWFFSKISKKKIELNGKLNGKKLTHHFSFKFEVCVCIEMIRIGDGTP